VQVPANVLLPGTHPLELHRTASCDAPATSADPTDIGTWSGLGDPLPDANRPGLVSTDDAVGKISSAQLRPIPRPQPRPARTGCPGLPALPSQAEPGTGAVAGSAVTSIGHPVEHKLWPDCQLCTRPVPNLPVVRLRLRMTHVPAFPPRFLMDEDTVDKTASQVQLSGSYLLYMGTSGVLAAVALLSDSIPILIGSMIVAPLMPALAMVPFALVARRRGEAARGLRIALIGLGVAFATAWATTAVMAAVGVIASDTVLLDKPLLQERVHPGWWSMAAAVAAGLAGITAQAREKTDTLIGTVAALALVPAVGASAIAVYVGAPAPALGGLLLLGMNVGLIVAMGVIALLVSAGREGLRPLALAPVAIIIIVGLLLVWAQSTGTVPRTPSNSGPTSGTASLPIPASLPGPG